MTTKTVPVSEENHSFIAEQAAAEGFASPGANVDALVRQAQLKKARQALEAKLLQAMSEPATEMTREEWAEMEREVWEEHRRDQARPVS